MRTYLNSPEELSRAAFGAVRNFSTDDNSAMQKLGEIEACEALCRILQPSPDHIGVFWKGFWVIDNLCADPFNRLELGKHREVARR